MAAPRPIPIRRHRLSVPFEVLVLIAVVICASAFVAELGLAG
jgi:hypothetical protein